jgi:diguanylate cyclase (GGDEF)-like protein
MKPARRGWERGWTLGQGLGCVKLASRAPSGMYLVLVTSVVLQLRYGETGSMAGSFLRLGARRMKALLIEDTVTSATLVCHLMNKMGLECAHARDGASGIEAFKKDKPDLILLDVIMPGMDGFEVAQRIRQLERDGEWTPIIFLSARTADEDVERGIAVGGDDYLVKPVSEAVLKAKVSAMQRIAQMRASLLVLTRKLDEANRELTRLSAVDGLTGIANRRSFDAALLREWRRSARVGASISLLVVDVDCFKQFNDAYGHQVGDECLKAVARALVGHSRRPADLIARYGGEEFAAVLPDTSEEGARIVAEAMRNAVQSLAITHRFSSAARVVTVSIGIATVTPGRSDESGFVNLLKSADQALYESKHAGRNRWTSAPATVSTL